MVSGDEFVCIGTSSDPMVIEAVRASLEARGIPFTIHGAQATAMLGSFYGAPLASRVMVPRSHAALAVELAEEVMGELDDVEGELEDEEHPTDAHPMRREPEDEDELEDEEERRVDRPRKPKSVAIPIILAVLGIGIGFSNIYVGRPNMGGALILLAVLGLILSFGGNWIGLVLLAAVWTTDLVGGTIGVITYNRAQRRLAAA